MTASGSIAIVGDLMLASREAEARARDAPGYRAAIARLRGADAVIANLEMPLSTRGSRVRKVSNLRSDPIVLPAVWEMGVGVVSLANNHMMDYGAVALADTIAALDDAGIVHTGAGADLETAFQPVVVEGGGARIGVLSFSCTVPMESDAGIGKPGIAPIRVGFAFEVDPNLMAEQPGTVPVVQSWTDPEDRNRACDAIAALAREVDCVVVMIHWGVPGFWLSPSLGHLATYQQVLGHAFVDAGAGLVIGHHSHSLHPIEVYHGTPIFYSLGNFLFENPRAFMEPESIIVEFDPASGRCRLVPLWLDDEGFPALVEGERAAAVLEKLRILSQPFGDTVRIDGDLGYLADTAANLLHTL